MLSRVYLCLNLMAFGHLGYHRGVPSVILESCFRFPGDAARNSKALFVIDVASHKISIIVSIQSNTPVWLLNGHLSRRASCM